MSRMVALSPPSSERLPSSSTSRWRSDSRSVRPRRSATRRPRPRICPVLWELRAHRGSPVLRRRAPRRGVSGGDRIVIVAHRGGGPATRIRPLGRRRPSASLACGLERHQRPGDRGVQRLDAALHGHGDQVITEAQRPVPTARAPRSRPRSRPLRPSPRPQASSRLHRLFPPAAPMTAQRPGRDPPAVGSRCVGTRNTAPSGGSHGLGVEQVGTAPDEHHPDAAGRLCGPDQGADVAGIRNLDQRQQGATLRRCGGDHVCALGGLLVHHGHHGLGRPQVQHLGQRARHDLSHPDPAEAAASTTSPDGRPSGVGLDVDAPDRCPRRKRLGQQHRSVDQVRTLGGTHAAAPREAPQQLQFRVRGAQWAQFSAPAAAGCASSAAWAAVTSAPKAASSRTARSARTLRSTSMPAIFRPLMNRL